LVNPSRDRGDGRRPVGLGAMRLSTRVDRDDARALDVLCARASI
jgi:hypothetical protein